MNEDRQRVIKSLRYQSGAPEPMYEVLLRALADDVEADGPGWRPFAAVAHLPWTENLPLRLMGAAHRLALTGDAPDYARHLPSCGGDGDAEAAWPVLRDLCATGALDDGILQPVQTNEVARTASLLPAFALITRETGMRLRVREIGASAGLLLRFDRYRYTIGEAAWGEASSPVHIVAEGSAPLGPVEVADRRGCDRHPLDPVRDRMLLLSFIWPTQLNRFRTTEAALTFAAGDPVAVDELPATEWLPTQLEEFVEGATTVVYHSIVWSYLTADEQETLRALIDQAGAAATSKAPLAWLRLEPHHAGEVGAELRLTLWPGGEDRSLAFCGYHGTPVHWGASPP